MCTGAAAVTPSGRDGAAGAGGGTQGTATAEATSAAAAALSPRRHDEEIEDVCGGGDERVHRGRCVEKDWYCDRSCGQRQWESGGKRRKIRSRETT